MLEIEYSINRIDELLTLSVFISLMVEFLNNISDKLLITEKISSFRFKYKFFYDLFNCKFCKTFHLSVILTLIFCIFFKFNIIYLLTPICVSSIIKFFKNDL